MRIGMDLDGPNLDFALNYYDGCRKVLRLPLPVELPAVTTWEFFKDVGHSTNEFVENCHLLADAGFLFRAAPLPGVAAAWRKLVDDGHTIHVGTDRTFGRIAAPGQSSRDATVKWLVDNRLPFHSVTFTGDKTLLDVDAFLEDKPENYAALWGAGVICFLVDRPWNQHVDAGPYRVADVTEFADRIVTLAATA